jgi:hypothetical protein
MRLENKFPFNQITGFFDADGSFEAKVYIGTQKPISFHVNIIFSQKSRDALQDVINSLEATNSKGPSPKSISSREIINPSGTTSTGNSISLAFSSDGGIALLNAWVKNPPKAPTKLLDYKIVKILAEVSESQTSTALDVVKKHLNPNSTVGTTDELTAGLALLWLRYRMFGKTKSNKNPKLLPINHYYTKTGATQAQIAESVQIGQQLYNPIEQEYQQHCQMLLSTPGQNLAKICEDYLLGYHMGDGSFQIQTEFGNGNSTFKSRFRWTLTDCEENKPLLVAIQNYLTTQNVSSSTIQPYITYNRLTISNYLGCLALVSLWKGKPLSKVRLNQYNCFVKALNLYNLDNFKADLALAEDFIRLKWDMNKATNSKKQGDLPTDLGKIRDWFKKCKN